MTLDLLRNLAALADKHDLVKKNSTLSVVCPEDKLRIPESRLGGTGRRTRQQVHRGGRD